MKYKNLYNIKEIYSTGEKITFLYKGYIKFSCLQEEMGLLDEIFLREYYNFVFAEKNYVIMDIGANIGCSILYFLAQNPELEHIYAYEPVKNTFQVLIENFSLNPQIAKKVSPINVAIGKDAGQAKISIGGTTVASTMRPEKVDVISTHPYLLTKLEEEVSVRSISAEIEYIKSNHHWKPINS